MLYCYSIVEKEQHLDINLMQNTIPCAFNFMLVINYCFILVGVILFKPCSLQRHNKCSTQSMYIKINGTLVQKKKKVKTVLNSNKSWMNDLDE